MRKLFRSIMVAVAVVVTATTMMACGDDDSTAPGGGPSIAGTWHLMSVDGEPLPSFLGIESQTVTFESNGQYRIDWEFVDDAPDTEIGTYTFDGTTLTTRASGGNGFNSIAAHRDGDQLTLGSEADELVMVYEQ
jgi:hypothetical protein